jgi:hypothetical protein
MIPILPDQHPHQEYLDWVGPDRLRFLNRWCHCQSNPILDIGPPNRLSREFAAAQRLELVNTKGDLDTLAWVPDAADYPRFSDVLCLEVLEHLANPLRFLIVLRTRMAPGGRLWLTTPKASWRWLQHKDHFTEYDRRRLIVLLEMAGFKIEFLGLTKSGYPLHTFWRGVRPCIRALTRWCYCLKAIKPRSTP